MAAHFKGDFDASVRESPPTFDKSVPVVSHRGHLQPFGACDQPRVDVHCTLIIIWKRLKF